MVNTNWQEVESVSFMVAVTPDLRTFRRRTRDGTLSVMAGTEPDGFHLSISHPRRYPSWDELCEARDAFTPPEMTFVQKLPPRDRWVNLHENCFHLWESKEAL